MGVHVQSPQREVLGISVINGIAIQPRRRSNWWMKILARIAATGGADLMREVGAHRAARHLAAMDDHTLRDIGIHRSNIDYVIRHGRRDFIGE